MIYTIHRHNTDIYQVGHKINHHREFLSKYPRVFVNRDRLYYFFNRNAKELE